MDESNRHAALADRRGNPLHRAQSHIATRENSGGARFEQVRITVVRPASSLHHVVTGQDIAVIVSSDVRRKPPGFRIRADEDKKATAVVPTYRIRAVAYVDRCQIGVA